MTYLDVINEMARIARTGSRAQARTFLTRWALDRSRAEGLPILKALEQVKTSAGYALSELDIEARYFWHVATGIEHPHYPNLHVGNPTFREALAAAHAEKQRREKTGT